MSKDTKTIKIGKVQITSVLETWWESDFSDVLSVPISQVISAIEYNGGLYLIYWYEEPQKSSKKSS